MTTQVDQNRGDEDGQLAHQATPKAVGHEADNSLLPLGTHTPWGRIGAITNQGGERYYMMSKNKGRDVALMPADVVEVVVSDMAKYSPEVK